MPCLVCKREVMGPFPAIPEWLAPWRDDGPRVCSILCLSIMADKGSRRMTDPTKNETVAVEAAAEAGGEYLDVIGKTDLATLTRDEYLTFVEGVITTFCDRLRQLESRP